MIKLSFLGTGDVRQVPVFGCQCKVCYRARVDTRARRRPCSALFETEECTLLLDGGLTDLAERFDPMSSNKKSLEGILLTHYHVDHVQGLFHLRWGLGDKLPVYGPDDPEGCADLFKHPGILDFQPPLVPFERVHINGIGVTPIPLQHSKPTLGYLLDYQGVRIAYLTDTVGLPEDSLKFLRQFCLDLMVIDCSHPPQDSPPRNHNDLNLALQIHNQLSPAKTVLTHISHEMDLWLVDNPNQLPESVQVVKDGESLVF